MNTSTQTVRKAQAGKTPTRRGPDLVLQVCQQWRRQICRSVLRLRRICRFLLQSLQISSTHQPLPVVPQRRSQARLSVQPRFPLPLVQSLLVGERVVQVLRLGNHRLSPLLKATLDSPTPSDSYFPASPCQSAFPRIWLVSFTLPTTLVQKMIGLSIPTSVWKR